MDANERKIYTEAFRKSDGKRMTGKTGAAKKAVQASRDADRKKEMARLAAKMRKSGDVQKAVEGKPMSKDPKGLYEKKKKKQKLRVGKNMQTIKRTKPTANKTASEKARAKMNKRRELGQK